MLRKIGLLLAVLVFAPFPASGQDNAEVFGGYSYMRFNTSPGANLNGWEISGQYKFTDWFGGVADFDGHYGSVGGVRSSVYTYLFGAQVSVPSRVSPFARALFGGAHFGAQGLGRSSLSVAIGTGIDVELTNKVYWRLIQADYLVTDFTKTIENNLRVSTGIVLRF